MVKDKLNEHDKNCKLFKIGSKPNFQCLDCLNIYFMPDDWCGHTFHTFTCSKCATTKH